MPWSRKDQNRTQHSPRAKPEQEDLIMIDLSHSLQNRPDVAPTLLFLPEVGNTPSLSRAVPSMRFPEVRNTPSLSRERVPSPSRAVNLWSSQAGKTLRPYSEFLTQYSLFRKGSVPFSSSSFCVSKCNLLSRFRSRFLCGVRFTVTGMTVRAWSTRAACAD